MVMSNGFLPMVFAAYAYGHGTNEAYPVLNPLENKMEQEETEPCNCQDVLQRLFLLWYNARRLEMNHAYNSFQQIKNVQLGHSTTGSTCSITNQKSALSSEQTRKKELVFLPHTSVTMLLPQG